MPRSDPTASAPLVPVQPARCGLCDADDSRPYAVSADYEYGTCRNEWRFVECAACGTIYLNPRPAPEALPVIYPPNYYSYNYDQQISWLARTAKSWLDRRTLTWLIGQLNAPLQAYCDVGCGNGRYLRSIAARGIPHEHIYGTELDGEVVRRLVAEGFQVERSTLEEARGIPQGGIQLMTMFSVLEHVAEPWRLLQKARTILAPGGLLVAEIPNPRSLNARWFRNRYWGGYHTPRHWNLFAIDALSAAAGRAGLRVKTSRRTTGHAFWLFSLHHYVRFELGWDSVGRLLHPATCLPGVALATAFDLLRARAGRETDNLIVVLERV
jgi:SAM-dependent methyltransferase